MKMKNPLLKVVSLVATLICIAPMFAQEKPATTSTVTTNDDAETKYTRAIERRAADILEVLEMSDPAKSAKVHDIIVAQYRALRAWHDTNDSKLKELNKQPADPGKEEANKINASLKTQQDQFIAKLSAQLTPEQVEKVKDKMTYNKVQVTFNAYCQMLPDLTAEQKAKILSWLKEAREEAMDAGSADEKSAVFNRYKGKINNYLSTAGYDVKTASKNLGKKQPTKSDDKAPNEPK